MQLFIKCTGFIKQTKLRYKLKHTYFKNKQSTHLLETENNKNQLLLSRPDLRVVVATVEDDLNRVIRDNTAFKLFSGSADTLTILDVIFKIVSDWIISTYYPDVIASQFVKTINREEAQILYDYLVNFGMAKQILSED